MFLLKKQRIGIRGFGNEKITAAEIGVCLPSVKFVYESAQGHVADMQLQGHVADMPLLHGLRCLNRMGFEIFQPVQPVHISFGTGSDNIGIRTFAQSDQPVFS